MKVPEKYILKFLRKADTSYNYAKLSWSQQGEDLLIDFIFRWIFNCDQFSYLDIGAHHPHYLSNTALFYKKGMRGVNIEPDPSLFDAFRKHRPEDININAGVGAQKGDFDFYILSSPTLNTFSKEEAERLVELHKPDMVIKNVSKIKVIPVNEILNQYFSKAKDFFISIDVEGLDMEILRAIDLEKFRPKVICIETNSIEEASATNYLNERNYSLYAMNNTNCIYISQKPGHKL